MVRGVYYPARISFLSGAVGGREDEGAFVNSARLSLEELFSRGRENVLSEHPAPVFGYAQLDEPSIYRAYERLLGRVTLPWLILGHSHDPKYIPGIVSRLTPCGTAEPNPPAWGASSPEAGGYLNTGTTGMWSEMLWFATVEADSSGTVHTLLKAARFASSNAILIKTFASVCACRPQGNGGGMNPSQWLSPIAASDRHIPVLQ